MPRAHKKRCIRCNREYYATRSDSMYCQEKCRTATRMEDAKFAVPKIPKSGVRGVTYSRVHRRWHVRIPDDSVKGQFKYVGSFIKLEEAIAFHKEIMK